MPYIRKYVLRLPGTERSLFEICLKNGSGHATKICVCAIWYNLYLAEVIDIYFSKARA